MIRSLAFFFVFALAGPRVQAQPRSAIVTSTPDGFVLADVPDAPLTDGPAVLLTHTSPDDASSGWTLRVLRPGENPMETLRARGDGVRFTRDTRVAADRPARVRLRASRAEISRERDGLAAVEDEIIEMEDDLVRMDGQIVEMEDEIVELEGEIVDVRASRIAYTISARMEGGFELADPLVSELSDAPALDELALQSDGTQTTLEVRLTFDSLEALTAWRDAGTFSTLRHKATSVRETVSVR